MNDKVIKVMKSKGYRSLIEYEKAFAVAMKIYKITEKYPKTETYSLIDQVRRSSRSVCSCIAEAYRKRQYQGYFVNKCTDADGETARLLCGSSFHLHADISLKRNLTSWKKQRKSLIELTSMIESPEKFLPKEKIKQ